VPFSVPFRSSSSSFLLLFGCDDGREQRRRRPGQRRPVRPLLSASAVSRGSVAGADAGPVDELEADELASEAREVDVGGDREVGCLEIFFLKKKKSFMTVFFLAKEDGIEKRHFCTSSSRLISLPRVSMGSTVS